MARMLRTLSLALALCAPALADQLVMRDGRVLTGKITAYENSVTIVMEHGTMSFPRSQVASIDLKDTPAEQFTKRLADIKGSDTDAMCALADWAVANGLKVQADTLYQQTLKISPDHKGARKALGFVMIDKQWRTLDEGLEMARNKLEAGRYEALLTEVLPALEDVAPQQWPAIRELQAQACLRKKDFAVAAQTYRELAKKSSAPAAQKFSTIADLLSDNRDGMYVLTEDYPPEAKLVGKKFIPAGPASLADPLVLEAALRDRARKELATGRAHLEDGIKVEPTDPDAAAGKYLQAAKAFDRADALVPQIALSHRVEIARRRISAIRKDSVVDAAGFDKKLEDMGKADLTQQAYRQSINQMVRHLDNVRDNLKNVLDIAKPFPTDLVMEIKWAQQDLKKVEAMRLILVGELNANK